MTFFSASAALLPFLNECITLSTAMVDVVVHGKATSNLTQDIDQGAQLADQCRETTLQCIDLFTNYQTGSLRIETDSIKINDDRVFFQHQHQHRMK